MILIFYILSWKPSYQHVKIIIPEPTSFFFFAVHRQFYTGGPDKKTPDFVQKDLPDLILPDSKPSNPSEQLTEPEPVQVAVLVKENVCTKPDTEERTSAEEDV